MSKIFAPTRDGGKVQIYADDCNCLPDSVMRIENVEITIPLIWTQETTDAFLALIRDQRRTSLVKLILDAAPKRVAHLARFGKKKRTRKKNLNRACGYFCKIK